VHLAAYLRGKCIILKGQKAKNKDICGESVLVGWKLFLLEKAKFKQNEKYLLHFGVSKSDKYSL
jgi:hypothetical protein